MLDEKCPSFIFFLGIPTKGNNMQLILPNLVSETSAQGILSKALGQ